MKNYTASLALGLSILMFVSSLSLVAGETRESKNSQNVIVWYKRPAVRYTALAAAVITTVYAGAVYMDKAMSPSQLLQWCRERVQDILAQRNPVMIDGFSNDLIFLDDLEEKFVKEVFKCSQDQQPDVIKAFIESVNERVATSKIIGKVTVDLTKYIDNVLKNVVIEMNDRLQEKTFEEEVISRAKGLGEEIIEVVQQYPFGEKATSVLEGAKDAKGLGEEIIEVVQQYSFGEKATSVLEGAKNAKEGFKKLFSMASDVDDVARQVIVGEVKKFEKSQQEAAYFQAINNESVEQLIDTVPKQTVMDVFTAAGNKTKELVDTQGPVVASRVKETLKSIYDALGNNAE